MHWFEAVKAWNHKKRETNTDHCWCNPRRGTPEYAEVEKIRGGARASHVGMKRKPKAPEAAPKAAPKPKVRKPKTGSEVDIALEKIIAEKAAKDAIKVVSDDERRKAALEKLRAFEKQIKEANAAKKRAAAVEKLKAWAAGLKKKAAVEAPVAAAKQTREEPASDEARVRRNIGAYMTVSDEPSDEIKIEILKYLAENSEALEDESHDYDIYNQEFAVHIPESIYRKLESDKAFRDGLLKSVEMLFRDLGIERISYRKDRDDYYISMRKSDYAGEKRSKYRQLLDKFDEELKIIGKLSKGGFKEEMAAMKRMQEAPVAATKQTKEDMMRFYEARLRQMNPSGAKLRQMLSEISGKPESHYRQYAKFKTVADLRDELIRLVREREGM